MNQPPLDTAGSPAVLELPRFPMPRRAGCPFDPAPEVTDPAGQDAMRQVQLWDGGWAWLVTNYADVRALFADPRISHDTNNPAYPHESAGFRERAMQGQSFVNMDDPAHGRLRRMVTPPFSSRRIQALRPLIQAQVDQLVDELLAGPKPADLVARFALPLPSLMICALLGVPAERQDFFQDVARTLIEQSTAPDVAREAQGQLLDYLEELVGQKAAAPAEDVLSDLAVKYVSTGEMTPREAAVTARLLLVAGHETTANMIALGTFALLQHRDQLDALRETADEELIASTAEELLRYLSIAHLGPRRFALEDIEVNSGTIRAGEGVILAVDGANRSAELFPEPERLDIHRDARRHLAFGFGIHQCLGQSLARLELQLVYGTLYKRIPTLRLAIPAEEVQLKSDGIIYGVHALPVTW